MLRGLKGLYHLLVAIVANIWFGFPSRKLTVIGVTGTDGKTTTTTLVYEILKANGFKTSMISTVHAVIAGHEYDTGFHVTTPTPWFVQKYLREAVHHGDTHMVLEVTSHALSQYRVFGVRFTVGVLTNVTHEHLDWHGTMDSYIATKLTLLKRAEIAVINRDEAYVYQKAIQMLRHKKYITYGIHREAMVNPKTHPFRTKLPGEFNTYNILACLAVVQALGIDQKKARLVVARFPGVPGRMETVATKPFRVIVDFAHTPNGIDKALATVRPTVKKRLIHVFGSAGLRDRTKRPFMGAASAKFADVIILTEEDFRTEDVDDVMSQIASGIPAGHDVYRYPNRQDAINFAVSIAKPGDAVILTGKAHEKSICRGRTEYPWNEFEAVKKALGKL